MGEVGEPTDPIDQGKTNRHQRQGETIDDSVDNDSVDGGRHL
jgi:hypothetical protein